jgi:6-phosphogluconolactonase (cycloisomerase 2 family)
MEISRPVPGFRAFVGCRTTIERGARGRGIEVFDVSVSGRWQHRQTMAAGHNPSFLLVSPDQRLLYCAHGDGSTASSFRIGTDGLLQHLNTTATHGRNPVHLIVSPGGQWLLVANYATGDVVSIPIGFDGALGAVAHQLRLPNRAGPHPTQQKGAHPHQLVFDPSGHWLMVPDKGGDAIHTVQFNELTGSMELVDSLATAPMTGPRHMVFSADGQRAWIVLELSSQVLCSTFDPRRGRLAALDCLSTVPEDFEGENTGAGIALLARGDLLFISNRGHGSVVRFAVDQEQCVLGTPNWVPAQGRVPRFIVLDPSDQTLLIANEDDDSIMRLKTGVHDLTEVVRSGSPVCIAFARRQEIVA